MTNSISGQHKSIGIIGGGHMGSAIFDRLLAIMDPASLFISDTHTEKLSRFTPAQAFTDNNDMLSRVVVVFFAVKPESFDSCIRRIGVDMSDKLIISIMAGISLHVLRVKTKGERIVRSMPNLGTKIGKGLTGWVATEAMTEADKEIVRNIFEALGNHIELQDESLMNSLGAVSGSGPAYFFYLTELLEEKALAMGFTQEQARLLAETTFCGAASLLKNEKKTAKEWREAVTSKGGITEQAFMYLKDHQFGKIFHRAIDAARKRGDELV